MIRYLISILIFMLTMLSHNLTAQHYLIENVSIVDVRSGNTTSSQSIEIKDELIISIHDKIPKALKKLEKVDGSGKFVIPGLWDMHTHYSFDYNYANALLLANGVTGIRDMWGIMDSVQHIRNQVNQKKLNAPDIYASGNIVDGHPPIWPGSKGVTTADEAIAEVDLQAEQGVDFIKVYSLLDSSSYVAIANRCNELSIPFAGHLPESVSIWDGISLGQQSMEHLYGMLEASSTEKDSFAKFTMFERFGPKAAELLADSFDENIFDEIADRLASSNTWICPTLTVLRNIANLDDKSKKKDPRLKYIPSYVKYMWDPKNDFRFKNAGEYYFEASRKKYNKEKSLIKIMNDKGVKLLAGTDFPNPYCYPGFSIHEELSIMVDAGLTPIEALRTATINPAIFMGNEGKIGEVKTGQKANLVILDKNPLENISNTEQINAVILRGVLYDRDMLDDLLEQAHYMALDSKF